jgi:hypothetical protein
MIAEHTKLLNQESRRRAVAAAASNVQSITDKMSRLTNRKIILQKPKLMINEYGSSSGDKGVMNNHSNKNKSSTVNEGKRLLTFFKFIRNYKYKVHISHSYLA